MNAMYTAPYIVIDGVESCGKDTQMKLLVDRARQDGRSFVQTREPGGTVLGESIRTVFVGEGGMYANPVAQCYLHFAQRAELIEKVVAVYRERGIPVFSNRGDSSTLAYQGYGLEAWNLVEWIWGQRDRVFGEHKPTLYVLLDVPAAVAHARSIERARGGGSEVNSAFDNAKIAFYERVTEGFRIFCQNPAVRAAVVDGHRSREEIHEDIYRIVSKECGWK